METVNTGTVKIALRQTYTRAQNCTKIFLHEDKFVQEDKIAPGVNFAQVKILLRGSLLRDSIKKYKKSI